MNAPKFKSLNDKREHRQSAFHIDAIEFIKKERDVVSIAVDTFSFDSFILLKMMFNTLGSETKDGALRISTIMDDVPAVGATVVVGQPKIKDGSGGPNLFMALI